MIQTSADDARMHLVDLIDAAVRGEDVYIAAEGEHGKKVVRLVAVAPHTSAPQFGSAQGKITVREDFDALLPDFAEYQ
jgi:antitoxin (DNA-binding transcriptional repressor) of toxin-antitoxin stability system